MFSGEDPEGLFSCNLVLATGSDPVSGSSQASVDTTVSRGALSSPPARRRPSKVSGVTRHRATGGSVQEKHRRFHQFEQELEAMRPLEAEDDGEGPCYSGDEGEDFVPASPSPPRKRYLHDEDSSP